MTGRAAELLEQAEADDDALLVALERVYGFVPLNLYDEVTKLAEYAVGDLIDQRDELAASLRLALTVVEAARRFRPLSEELRAALAAFERAGTDTNNETAE